MSGKPKQWLNDLMLSKKRQETLKGVFNTPFAYAILSIIKNYCK